MKAFLIVIVVSLLSGAVTVQPGRTWALSLTPVRPERVARQDTRERCPNITVRGAPLSCVWVSMERSTQQLQRTLERLQRLQRDQHRRMR